MMNEETQKPEEDILGITSLLEGVEKLEAKDRENVVTRVKSKGFIRRKMIHGRPYYYRVLSVRQPDGKVKQVVLKYLGTRCPRGYKPREKGRS